MAKLYDKIADTKTITKEEWLELRKSGIGGSDAGAVVGLNPYASAYSVYHEKLSLVESFEGNDKTRLGTDLEDYVAKRFEEESGKKVRRLNAMLRSKERPYMLADVDRMIVGENAGLECKTTANHERYNLENGEYPAYWACQCYHYMSVTGAEKWYICVLDLSTGKLSIIEIPRVESEISALEQLEKNFWTEHIEKRVVPNPNGSERCDDIIAKKYPFSDEELPVVDLFGYGRELAKLAEVKRNMKNLEIEKNALEQTLKEALGESAFGEYDTYKVSYKTTLSSRLDGKRLQKEMPDVYAKYSATSATRRFVFTNKEN